MKNNRFTKTQIATSLSIALGAFTAPMVYAADEAADNVEVIEVRGIRGSIIKSTAMKRDASGVVDAISAEDIGKFPDTNLAESMQRITGVSIDRSNGEGSRVTVRGFGPQYNMITLNGRAMASTSLPEGGGASDSRAFDFQNLSSNAIDSVEIYKTANAAAASGGIGATININTAKPLDNPGFVANIGGKLMMDNTVRDGVRDYSDLVTPELSGLLSWTDEEEMFGASFNGSFSQRDSSSTSAGVAQWRNSAFDGTIDNQIPDGADTPTLLMSAPDIGESYALPSDIAYTLWDRQRERTNAQLTLQYRPIENITATLDYTYSKLEQEQQGTDLSIWMDSYKSTIAFTEGLNPSPLFYAENRIEQAPRDIAVKQKYRNSVTEDDSIGLNIEWLVNDDLTLKFDYNDSSSESSPMSDYGNAITFGLGANVLAGQGGTFSASGLPAITIAFDDCDPRINDKTDDSIDNGGLNCSNTLDQSDVGSSIYQKSYAVNTNDITQARIDGTWLFDDGQIDFGIESREMDNYSVQSDANLAMGDWGVNNPGELPEGILEAIDFNDSLDDYKTEGWTQGFRGDTIELAEWAAEEYGIDLSRNPNTNVRRRIQEDITAAYVKASYAGEVAEMSYNVFVGLRYESTDSSSISYVAKPTAVIWKSNNDFEVVQGDAEAAELVTTTNSYEHFLPNIDFDINLTNDVKARASYSQTIARPQYGQLSNATIINAGPSTPTALGGTNGAASTGNPNLVPIESSNIDLSVEWYFQDTSYVSVGYFRKDVDKFIGNGPLVNDYYDLTDATGGPRVEQAIADLATAGIALNDTTLFSQVAATQLGEALYANGHTDNYYESAVDVIANSDDPLMTFLSQSPVNNKTAVIDGWELATQHFFGDTGFGVQANYTLVDGDIEFDLTSTAEQFALLGLSDTANIVGLYEKDGFSARIAYNWRDEFLNNAAIYENEPEFTEAYSQIDFSIGYQINEQLSMTFAGINITGEDPRRHGRTENQLTYAEEWSSRYELGVSYNF
ncbi:TonB-dependent receptor [Psychrosphaera saromensis]|uniref:TonB-dependent receptor n=1 Tax=Psychrosphaera saromensis TaxID=716813 RepID=A0A2S7UWD7_9GAMM|nr:TonB-dependent receptor [Psychrosphaera saromensis]PQJ53590.1 TonB-dependent receptor [Psychrosphaera saromensis]GHB64020.1 TonB-dependent receptor [Psychrosphaera saromensis]GLQ15649.1 TonB-dependent receptor [Psychrosphaera saromensis]